MKQTQTYNSCFSKEGLNFKLGVHSESISGKLKQGHELVEGRRAYEKSDQPHLVFRKWNFALKNDQFDSQSMLKRQVANIRSDRVHKLSSGQQADSLEFGWGKSGRKMKQRVRWIK
jgi:hypothetical protein